MSKPLPRFSFQEAITEARDAQRWVCQSCNKFIEERSESVNYCRSCKDYFDDCAAGLWSDWP